MARACACACTINLAPPTCTSVRTCCTLQCDAFMHGRDGSIWHMVRPLHAAASKEDTMNNQCQAVSKEDTIINTRKMCYKCGCLTAFYSAASSQTMRTQQQRHGEDPETWSPCFQQSQPGGRDKCQQSNGAAPEQGLWSKHPEDWQAQRAEQRQRRVQRITEDAWQSLE